MAKQYLVCLDPGHGPETANASPDGTYLEREFTWDMCQRLSRTLMEQGIAVILTRTWDVKPSLTQRAEVSNAAGADLFLSVHSNAAGNSGWSAPRGCSSTPPPPAWTPPETSPPGTFWSSCVWLAWASGAAALPTRPLPSW